MRASTVFLMLLAGGCSFPGSDFSGTSFLCDQGEPCPPGFDCESGRCVTGSGDGGMPDATEAEIDGASGGADADLPDGSPPDACVPLGEPTLPFFDDFQDGVRAGFWTSFAPGATSVDEIGGRLVVSPQSNAQQTRFAGYRTADAYDHSGNRVFVEVTAMVSLESEAQARFLVSQDPPNQIYMIQQGGTLRFGTIVGGVSTEFATAPYDPNEHRYWQIREEGGTVFGEVSSDGEIWSELGSGTAPPFVGEVEIELSAGTELPVSDPGSANYDNVNGGVSPCP